MALSERGLRSALESLSAACETPVTLDVQADELPEHVELAAYFIVSESLTNASKYAAAGDVRIRVARSDRRSREPRPASASRPRASRRRNIARPG